MKKPANQPITLLDVVGYSTQILAAVYLLIYSGYSIVSALFIPDFELAIIFILLITFVLGAVMLHATISEIKERRK